MRFQSIVHIFGVHAFFFSLVAGLSGLMVRNWSVDMEMGKTLHGGTIQLCCI